jgi:hypothetical protein
MLPGIWQKFLLGAGRPDEKFFRGLVNEVYSSIRNYNEWAANSFESSENIKLQIEVERRLSSNRFVEEPTLG